jgi:CSLREA domain-containing protein
MGRRFALIRAVFTFAGVFCASVALLQADTYVVNSTADQVDTNPADGACSTAGGTCTLRAAIQTASAHAGADEVVLPAGIFRLTLLGTGDDACLTGDLDISGGADLTITGADRDATIIDGLAADRVFHVLAGPNVTVRDLTIQNGAGGTLNGGGLLYAGPGGTLTVLRSRFLGNLANAGGAVACSTVGNCTIADCVFEDNQTMHEAGAISVGTVTGVMQISRSQFLSNDAHDAGGAVRISGSGSTTIADSTFENCQSQSTGGAAEIRTAGGLTLTNCEFIFNIADDDGGAVAYTPPGAGDCSITNCQFLTNASGNGGDGGACSVLTTGSLTVSGGRFDANYASGAGGGLLAQVGPSLSVQNTEFLGNFAMGNVGGGLALAVTGALTLTNILVSDNEAHDGGGGLSVNGQASATITGSTFSGNRARNLPGGGGAVIAGPGSPEITACTFSQNTVENGQLGGGLVIHASAGGMTMRGCAFIANEAIGGGSCGGLYYQSAGAGTITNCTFSGNLATNGGGGIGQGGFGDLTLTNCTLTDNGATGPMGGGAILRGPGFAQVNLRNTIIANSFAGENCAGGTVSQGGNIDSGAFCLSPLIPGDHSNTGPLLGPLADNGGPTLTHALLPGSPAIDAGAVGWCGTTDQRGVARPLDGDADGTPVCDVGAIEFADCNNNGQDDTAEIAGGAITDCNSNGLPDNCDSPDTDADGLWDVCDSCTDTDHDGFGDPGFPANTCAADLCPADPNKHAPGLCGCGLPDTDVDGDGAPACLDLCPNDPGKQAPGLCGCGVADGDTDGDLVPDCLDNCGGTANLDQADANGDGVGDACAPAPAGAAASASCGVCGLGAGMMMPLTLLGLGWMKRRERRHRSSPR